MSSKHHIETDHAIASKRAKKEADDYVLPADWPKRGEEIDLSVQDLPHDSADTEWWYINSHVVDANGRDLSFFASFFRIVKEADEHGKPTSWAHSLTWAVVDPAAKKYVYDPVLDPSTPEILEDGLKKGTYDVDPRLGRAFLEVVQKKNVPLPDRMSAPGSNHVAKDKLSLVYDNVNKFWKDEQGKYHLQCENKAKGIAIDVVFTPKKKPQRQAHEGVVKIGVKQDTMFYYFIPRNECHGTVTLDNQTVPVTGDAWYDHEFGGEIKPSKKKGKAPDSSSSSSSSSSTNTSEEEEKAKEPRRDYAWNWFGLMLSDGSEITATNLCDIISGRVEDHFAIHVLADGNQVEYSEMELTGSDSWVSIRTTNDYPQTWHLKVPQAQIDLTLKATFEQQEFITLIAKPAFWEGRVNITGTVGGKPVTGKGFIERHGFQIMNNLDAYFKRISKEVLKIVADVLPLEPTDEQIRDLMCSSEFGHLMQGVSKEVFVNTIIRPIRDIVDRGGKSWRSFAFLLCIDCVGGESERSREWLCMPEIMHVGSLIVDDIQDKSPIRRGGPACHVTYGDAIAINAGNAAYFLSLHVLQSRSPWLTDSLRIKLYELYFLCLRAGHAGQAFDINGLDYLMDDAVKTGDCSRLVDAVTCTHRLKSAVPAGALARMGGETGGGTKEQVIKLGLYLESIGIAFQIIDDVLNLRGFKGNTKDRGEDLKAGKVTFPVAKAMNGTKLTYEERKYLWESIRSKPQENEKVYALIDIMEKAGAIEASVQTANDLVTQAWKDLDSCLPDSFYKMLLRSFGWYVLERHY